MSSTLTQYPGGYLPSRSSMVSSSSEGLGLSRALDAASNGATDPAVAAGFAQRGLRVMLIIRDLGYWAHFVQHASVPLHLNVHFRCLGEYPNPNSNSTERGLHAHFEGAFVSNIAADEILALVAERPTSPPSSIPTMAAAPPGT